MKNLTQFFYPKSLVEASELLKKEEGAVILGGGSTLSQSKSPNVKGLIVTSKLGLNYIKLENNLLKIGASTKISDIINSEEVKNHTKGFLNQCVENIGSTLTKNVVTAGGNIAQILPWADMPVALLVLNAKIKIHGDSEKEILYSDFLKNSAKKSLQNNEFITEIIIPEVKADMKTDYFTFLKVKVDYAIGTLSFLYSVKNNKIEEARLAIGAFETKPKRLTEIEEFLKGKELSEDIIDTAVTNGLKDISFSKDFRCEEAFKKNLFCVYVKRSIQSLMNA